MVQILFLVLVTIAIEAQSDPVSQQLETFLLNHPDPIGNLTTSYGVPIDYNTATYSINSDLLRNAFFMEYIIHSVQERIPARSSHTKGSGAFGFLEITDDITKYCRAKVFSKIGKITPLVARFSLVISDMGSADTVREPKGLAIKLYTEDGILDILTLSTPMYVYKDPLLFPTFIHTFQSNPVTELRDMNMLWDFITLRPEAMFAFLYMFGDRGISDGYRHIPAFSIQTIQTVNKYGESYFMRFHFLPDAGIKNFNTKEAMKIAGEDPDYAARDLYDAIAKGNFPSWTMYAQILTTEQVTKLNFNVFDVTRIIPKKDFPLQRIGKLVLDRNPENHFAQIEQLAFNPGNLPDGFVGAPDKLFESRVFLYREAQSYRLGVNYNKIDVNCPVDRVLTYLRDGIAPVGYNGKDAPNYYPNTFSGPIPVKNKNDTPLLKIHEIVEPNNFDQIRYYYENELSPDEKERTIENLVTYVAKATKSIQHRVVDLLTTIQPELGVRVCKALINIPIS